MPNREVHAGSHAKRGIRPEIHRNIRRECGRLGRILRESAKPRESPTPTLEHQARHIGNMMWELANQTQSGIPDIEQDAEEEVQSSRKPGANAETPNAAPGTRDANRKAPAATKGLKTEGSGDARSPRELKSAESRDDLSDLDEDENTPSERKKIEAICEATRQGLTGIAYCRFMKANGFTTSQRLQKRGCPADFVYAYRIEEWRHPLNEEKSKKSARLRNSDSN